MPKSSATVFHLLHLLYMLFYWENVDKYVVLNTYKYNVKSYLYKESTYSYSCPGLNHKSQFSLIYNQCPGLWNLYCTWWFIEFISNTTVLRLSKGGYNDGRSLCLCFFFILLMSSRWQMEVQQAVSSSRHIPADGAQYIHQQLKYFHYTAELFALHL